jgi:hypothetical protein
MTGYVVGRRLALAADPALAGALVALAVWSPDAGVAWQRRRGA